MVCVVLDIHMVTYREYRVVWFLLFFFFSFFCYILRGCDFFSYCLSAFHEN